MGKHQSQSGFCMSELNEERNDRGECPWDYISKINGHRRKLAGVADTAPLRSCLTTFVALEAHDNRRMPVELHRLRRSRVKVPSSACGARSSVERAPEIVFTKPLSPMCFCMLERGQIGKAVDFESAYCRFEPCRSSH